MRQLESYFLLVIFALVVAASATTYATEYEEGDKKRLKLFRAIPFPIMLHVSSVVESVIFELREEHWRFYPSDQVTQHMEVQAIVLLLLKPIAKVAYKVVSIVCPMKTGYVFGLALFLLQIPILEGKIV